MKSAVICFKCGMFKKYSDTYAVKVLQFFTPEQFIKVEGSEGKEKFVDIFLRKVRVCRTCIKRME